MAYTANTPNGARLPVTNRRITPTEAGNYVIMTDDIVVGISPLDARAGSVRLYERPLTDSTGTGINVRDTTTQKTFTPTVTFPPVPNTFYSNPFLGMLFFNLAHVNTKLQITYTAMGSLVVAEDINWLYVNAKAAGMPFYGQPVTLDAGQSRTIQKLFISDVWEVLPGDTAALNPANVSVKLINITDKNNYGSTITNTGTTTRSFLYRGLPMQTPEA